ncbi:MAG: hypothetical protein C9356_04245 [Oleiphilus sp.]|nr:MAG: hypothetical protein C9356_04245 [Oleiphilus sp.]
MVLAVYMLAGACAGLIAGLFGVGGGVIVVPVLIVVFEAQHFPPELLTHMAVGTSLATILFTSLSSVWNHHRLGSVDWRLFRPLSAGIVLGSTLGVLTVLQLDGELVKKLIGGFAVFVSLKMFLQATHESSRPLPGSNILVPAGLVIGWVSAIFGIGGGTLSVPFLSRYAVIMKRVVGTAAACGLPIAIAGTATNVAMGLGLSGRPEWSVGYIYIPAVAGIVISSVYFAKLGAGLAHRLPAERLKKLFALALMIVGLRFLFF